MRDRPVGGALRTLGAGTLPDMSDPVLVTIELRFRTDEDAQLLGDRVRESVALIVGRDNLEDYRLRVLPLTPPKKPRAL